MAQVHNLFLQYETQKDAQKGILNVLFINFSRYTKWKSQSCHPEKMPLSLPLNFKVHQ